MSAKKELYEYWLACLRNVCRSMLPTQFVPASRIEHVDLWAYPQSNEWKLTDTLRTHSCPLPHIPPPSPHHLLDTHISVREQTRQGLSVLFYRFPLLMQSEINVPSKETVVWYLHVRCIHLFSTNLYRHFFLFELTDFIRFCFCFVFIYEYVTAFWIFQVRFFLRIYFSFEHNLLKSKLWHWHGFDLVDYS